MPHRKTPEPKALNAFLDTEGSHGRADAGDNGCVMVHLRRATFEDAEGVAKVYVESWNLGFGHLMPPRVLDSDQIARWGQDLESEQMVWWVAEANATIVGFAGSGPSRDPVDTGLGLGLGELDTIAVAPAAWRQGIGGRLMNAALEDLIQLGSQEAILWTLADYEQGRKFYEATGWRTSGEVRNAGLQIAFRRSL